MNSTKALCPITISQSQVLFTRTVSRLSKTIISLNPRVPLPRCVHCTDINSTQENFVGFNKLYITLEKRIKILLSHYPMQYILYANNLIHVGLIEQTLIILILGHFYSGDTKFGPGKCAHNLSLYLLPQLKGRVTSIQRKRTLFLGQETCNLGQNCWENCILGQHFLKIVAVPVLSSPPSTESNVVVYSKESLIPGRFWEATLNRGKGFSSRKGVVLEIVLLRRKVDMMGKTFSSSFVRDCGFILNSIISGDTLALKKWLTTKRADIFKRTLIKNGSFPKLNYLT